VGIALFDSDKLLAVANSNRFGVRCIVWWHWMNGNISKDGIRTDLEWMHRAGLGGVQVFDAALATPQIVDHRIEYMTPEPLVQSKEMVRDYIAARVFRGLQSKPLTMSESSQKCLATAQMALKYGVVGRFSVKLPPDFRGDSTIGDSRAKPSMEVLLQFRLSNLES
jgi:hypothetical protein